MRQATVYSRSLADQSLRARLSAIDRNDLRARSVVAAAGLARFRVDEIRTLHGSAKLSSRAGTCQGFSANRRAHFAEARVSLWNMRHGRNWIVVGKIRFRAASLAGATHTFKILPLHASHNMIGAPIPHRSNACVYVHVRVRVAEETARACESRTSD